MADDATDKDLDVAALATAAGLALSPERQALLAPILSGLMADFAVLDTVDLGETPPAFGFDPRAKP
ncbi:MAG: hypothetical protein AAGI34_10830 [Pseudomonadota bacterium]